ncbi:hypothetical protein SASPL_157554 [Salvia splendens]|uniref:Uncharacterized protein n=1 Tax=Salvia splendens TaxID=180675 RepID=A0A8X8YU25_SALSN|nr:hypothetical protein SASPL_157554 [Salvia splendens]
MVRLSSRFEGEWPRLGKIPGMEGRGELVDVGFRGVDEPVDDLARLAEAELVLEFVELDGRGDREADAPVSQPPDRADLAVPVFSPKARETRTIRGFLWVVDHRDLVVPSCFTLGVGSFSLELEFMLG